jgi:multiple sugar transport system ATP-binding protein
VSDVQLNHITKRFRNVVALRDISFDIEDGEFFVLLGPTGAGKTTTLRVIAGLEKQDSGSIHFDGASVDNLSPA